MTSVLAPPQRAGHGGTGAAGRGAPEAPAARGTAARRSLPVEPFLALTVGCSTVALTHVVAPGRWLGVCAGLIVLLAVVTGLVRQRARRFVAPAVGTVVAAWAVVVLYGGNPGELAWVPTPGAVDRLGDLLVIGAEIIRASPAPLDPVPAIELFTVASCAGVFLIADHLACGRKAPALAGVPLLALWAPAAVIRWTLPTGVFLLAVASYLVLLAVAQGRVTRPVRTAPGAFVVLSAGATLGALLLGAVVPDVPGWGRFALRLSGSGAAGPQHPTPELSVAMDMRAPLGPRFDGPLLTYRSDHRPGPLRLHTVTTFDGRTWSRDETAPAQRPALDLLWPTPVEPSEEQFTLEVQVEALTTDRLPIPLEPRVVEVAGDWRYDEVRDEVVAVATTTRGLSYRVTAARRTLDPEVLRAAGDPDLHELGRYLQLPDSAYLDAIRDVAEEITAEATTPYDRVLALQTWFRSTGGFRYDTEGTPVRTDDAVWDFLEVRSGYCVQFATAMAVMARAVGVPTRLAVGYLPGEPLRPSGDVVVTGEQAHTWPEMYFTGVGWVRFEPTPAVQSGPLPAHANPSTAVQGGSAPSPSARPEATASPSPSTPGGVDPAGGGAGPDGESSANPAGALLLTALLAAGLAVLLAARAVRARRHAARMATSTPEQAWSELQRRLARSGVRWSPASTPRATVHTISEAVRARAGEELDPTSRRALEQLAAAVERTRYAPHPGPCSPADLAGWVHVAHAGVAELLGGRPSRGGGDRRPGGPDVSDRAARGGAPTAPRAVP